MRQLPSEIVLGNVIRFVTADVAQVIEDLVLLRDLGWEDLTLDNFIEACRKQKVDGRSFVSLPIDTMRFLHENTTLVSPNHQGILMIDPVALAVITEIEKRYAFYKGAPYDELEPTHGIDIKILAPSVCFIRYLRLTGAEEYTDIECIRTILEDIGEFVE